MNLLVTGFGNVLRGDDGFGVVVAERLLASSPPEGVSVVDVGIGGIHAVQLLLGGVDAFIGLDAVDLGRPAGTLIVQVPEIPELAPGDPATRDQLADMHYATPQRALMLARGLGVLPAHVLMVGCQVGSLHHLGEGLSAPVAAAVEPACREVRRIACELGMRW
ncbi:MAG: hydrogenase maturation protease [Mycobacteriales bacterium]